MSDLHWHWIDSDSALVEVLAAHAGATDVAVDTEFRRRDTYWPQVALVQLCWGEDAYLIDPIPLTDLSGLVRLFTDASVTKYLHSASEDLEVFHHWLGVLPRLLIPVLHRAA